MYVRYKIIPGKNYILILDFYFIFHYYDNIIDDILLVYIEF